MAIEMMDNAIGIYEKVQCKIKGELVLKTQVMKGRNYIEVGDLKSAEK